MECSKSLSLIDQKKAVLESLTFFKRERLKIAIKLSHLRAAKRLMLEDEKTYIKQMRDLNQRIQHDLEKHSALLKTKE